jgi:hypothetical protein
MALDPGYAPVEDQDEVGRELEKVVGNLQEDAQVWSSKMEHLHRQVGSLEEVDLASKSADVVKLVQQDRAVDVEGWVEDVDQQKGEGMGSVPADTL